MVVSYVGMYDRPLQYNNCYVSRESKYFCLVEENKIGIESNNSFKVQ